MNISMVGIDYNSAKVEEREQFSLTSIHAGHLAAKIMKKYEVSGCIVLSTCNRTEVWFSDLNNPSPMEVFLLEKGADIKTNRHLFIERSGEDAVQYLMELACGLHSQIFGEDQILSQVKMALSDARDSRTTDSVLESLFRIAVTAAKQIKTKVRLSMKDRSVPERAISILSETCGSLSHKNCVIIGNGEMGRLTAEILDEQGCNVYMTLREHKGKSSAVPDNCTAISYDDRMEYIAEADLIFSATLSPHYTIHRNQLEDGLRADKQYIFTDLAVPRDIEPSAADLKNVVLLDMDQLGIVHSIDEEQIREAYQIIDEYRKTFRDWYFYRDFIPVVTSISKNTGKVTNGKLRNLYKLLDLNKEQQKQAEESIQIASEKAIAGLMYRMRDYLTQDIWKDCVIALEQAAKDER